MNIVDIVIILVLLTYAVDGLRRGALALLFDLLGFAISLALSLRFYPLVATGVVERYFSIPKSFSRPVAFFAIWFVTETLFFLFIRSPLYALTHRIEKNPVNRGLGPIPALIKGSVVVAVFLVLFIGLPVSGAIKSHILSSKIGGAIFQKTTGFEGAVSELFGKAVEETLTFLTTKPGANETVSLGFETQDVSVDETAENRMLDLVNAERTSRGLKPLTMDPAIREVARAHSADMFARGYFSHVNPDGKTPFDRMTEGGVSFRAAGENIAFAPNVEVAHRGLMNSEGHRANILSSAYGRAGIGVMKSDVYGEMFTQNFAN